MTGTRSRVIERKRLNKKRSMIISQYTKFREFLNNQDSFKLIMVAFEPPFLKSIKMET